MNRGVQGVLDASSGGMLIDIECHMSNGLPGMVIVGFTGKAIDESRERIRSAFANSRIDLPRKRITLNLAPADIPKDGTSFDLAMAVSILLSSGMAKPLGVEKLVVIGELGLDGATRPVRGIIGKILAAQKLGIRDFIIPLENLQQALLIPHISIIAASSLRDVYLHLTGALSLKTTQSGDGTAIAPQQTSSLIDFCEVSGQARAKRALEIAAAGSHNVLLSGLPGTGKSMLGRALPTILPPMSRKEILEVTQLHSLASQNYETIITTRPLRSPHHTSSQTAIIGGGQHPRPGEISLAHHGVLLLDEFPEFQRTTIEALRQPLEDRVVHIARAKDRLTFPAEFLLVATRNPCPCGNYGSTLPCTCLPHQVSQYERKLSGPILDRLDIHVTVDQIKHTSLLHTAQEETSAAVQARVIKARERQYARYGSEKTNASLKNSEIRSHLRIDDAAMDLLNTAADRLHISARAYMRCIKVAQTISDLAESDTIKTTHISEALQYRRQEALAYST